MKKILYLLCVLCLVVCATVSMSACGGDETPAPSTQSTEKPAPPKYTVTVTDAFGNVPSDSIVIELFQNGEGEGARRMKDGTITFDITEGDYTFELSAVGSEIYYDQSLCVLSADSPSATVKVYTCADETEKQTIYVYESTTKDNHIPYQAVKLGEGGYYVTIDRPVNTYFVFTPTRSGIYRVTYEASKAVELGYYGDPNIVRQHPSKDNEVDGGIEFEVKGGGINIGNPGGTTQIVLGICSYNVKNCIIKIERIGNEKKEAENVEVQVDKNAVFADNYINSEFVNFDITDSTLKAVYSEVDGYYHLNSVDGPVIYIKITALTEEMTSQSKLPSFITMCEAGSNLCKYFYDGTEAIRVESYNTMFYGYADLCGTSGLYPLNSQLAEAVKNIGEQRDWFKIETENHIFDDKAPSVYLENAWLFACVYENQKALGSEQKPALVSASTTGSIKTNSILCEQGTGVVLRTLTKATITINDAENVKLMANGTEYVADDNGKITVVITENQNFTIVYNGSEEEAVVYFTFVEA